MLSHLTWMNEKDVYCYKVYSIIICLKNNWNINKRKTYIFYAINKEELFLILNMLKLKNNHVRINTATRAWRFNVKENLFKLASVADFNKDLNDESAVYVLLVANVTKNKKELILEEIKTNFN